MVKDSNNIFPQIFVDQQRLQNQWPRDKKQKTRRQQL